jgi:hypothetical protein
VTHEQRLRLQGGPITDFRSDLALIDDPVTREDADSDRMRDKAWEWFRADLLTRMKPGGRIVLIMTRWHEDDLAGRLLATEGDRWTVIKLPALAEADDPLGRPVGAPLWFDHAYGYGADIEEKRQSYERTGRMREWHALFQQ